MSGNGKNSSTAAQVDPPTNPIKALRFLGPGFILFAAVVGSGELIATTALGAKADSYCFGLEATKIAAAIESCVASEGKLIRL